MTSPDDAAVGEHDRLASVSSLVDAIGEYVADLTLLPAEALPLWLPGLPLPDGWSVIDLAVGASRPTRIAVRRPAGQPTGWDGCETINLFRFSGSVPDTVIQGNADRTLRDLGARNVISEIVPMPSAARLRAVRSRGTFSLGGRHVWARCTNYVYESGPDASSGSGGLVEHNILIAADYRTRLDHDMRQLTRAVHDALLRGIAAAHSGEAD